MRGSFSILLVMCVLLTIGVALVPSLDIGSEPRKEQGKTLFIDYSWRGKAAKVVEQNVTSRIEALVSSVKGVESVSSVSEFGSGRVTIELKRQADVSAVKFEIASLLRQMRGRLPEDLSYPLLSGGEVDVGRGDDGMVKMILSYRVNADMPDDRICSVVEREVKHKIEHVDGVNRVDVIGGTGQYM
ncbi:MAG: efflux RND transporter permease subunit, partial [Bacteroidaceae bacterium]